MPEAGESQTQAQNPLSEYKTIDEAQARSDLDKNRVVEAEPTTPAQQREQTRTILAQGLLLVFAGTIIASFWWANIVDSNKNETNTGYNSRDYNTIKKDK